MPTPSPIIAPAVGAAVETSIAPASSAMPLTPAATATRASAIGTSAATTVPNATTSTTSAARRPAASAPEVSASALTNAASPPSSAVTPASRPGSSAPTTAAIGWGPSCVDGRSNPISAKPMRPSGDTVPAVNGPATRVTWSRSAMRATVAAEDPDGALQAMGAVEEAGRQAPDELRHLLGVLQPEADPDGLGPQPGLADIPRLVDQIRAAGLDVSLAMDGLRSPLPARVELSAYRIVQEPLTNALKHGGSRTRAEVRVRADADGITVEVLDDGRGAPVPSPSGAADGGAVGHGLVGMRERAQLLGGRLAPASPPGTGPDPRAVARPATAATPRSRRRPAVPPVRRRRSCRGPRRRRRPDRTAAHDQRERPRSAPDVQQPPGAPSNPSASRSAGATPAGYGNRPHR